MHLAEKENCFLGRSSDCIEKFAQMMTNACFEDALRFANIQFGA